MAATRYRSPTTALYDISVAVHPGMPTYPGDPGVEIDTPIALARGDAANVSHLRFGAHTGTHVDAPAHFLAGGRHVKDLSLDVLIGPARVIEIPDSARAIGPQHVADLRGVERVLFKTRNSGLWRDQQFHRDFTHLTPEAARELVTSRVRLVGIDYLSIEVFHSPTHETHRILLEKEVIILEGLDLTAVPPGMYELLCLPLKLAGGAGDGAPARAVLRDLR